MTDMSTVYRGRRVNGVAKVEILAGESAEYLDPAPSQAVWNHSPTGFEWGYPGSGPAQLALALLLHATGDPEVASRHHQAFKFSVVAKWDQKKNWNLHIGSIFAFLRARGGAAPIVGGISREDLSDEE